jgi:Family of unknown function (DUF6406)
MTESEALRHGRIYRVSSGRVAVLFLSNPAYDGQPLRVELVVVPRGGEEQRVAVRPGEPFAFGDASWQVGDIDNVGTYDYVVHISRIGEVAPKDQVPQDTDAKQG